MRFLQEFKEFAVRGNVADMAVGIIIGAAFGKIVNSLVKDIVMPPLGLAMGRVDFSNLYANLGSKEYETLAQAEADGAPLLRYGMFVNSVIDFVIVAFAVFLLVRTMNKLRRREESGQNSAPTTKACPFCVSTIPLKATRCPQCTSELQTA